MQGKIYGKISNKILGKNGFGYDPIFIPNSYNETYGQMKKRKKMKIDHRYIAFKKLKKKLIFDKFIIFCFINFKFLNYFFVFKTKGSNFSFNFIFK